MTDQRDWVDAAIGLVLALGVIACALGACSSDSFDVAPEGAAEHCQRLSLGPDGRVDEARFRRCLYGRATAGDDAGGAE